MPFLPAVSFALLAAGLTLGPATPLAQSIQRCEAADGSVVYSNEPCPRGSRAVRALPPATQPSADAQQAARERSQRERELALSRAAQRGGGTPAPPRSRAVVPLEDAQRAVDCAYLRAELDSNRRLRNVLTTRRYYSTEDVELMDARDTELAENYRRFCSR
jgi:hypothetical protein